MKMFPRVVWAVTAALALSVSASAQEWLTDYDKALAKAKEENKPVLVNFTGSDWCGWCVRLKKEVFDTKPFKRFAEKNVVLLEVDFPKDKSKISAETQKQNGQLQQKYKIQGYPTIILLDETGKELERGGYVEGGTRPFVKQFKELKKK